MKLQDRLIEKLRARRDEEGATALLVVILTIVLFAGAALAVDYSSLVMERQKLHDHIDSAAHAGAFELPSNGTGASTTAINMAKGQDSTLNPSTELFCVVGVNASGGVNTSQIPSTCTPGPAPYTAAAYPGLKCNAVICAIPCKAISTAKCNTILVSDTKTVPFGFGRVIGTPTGNTGSVQTAACKGSCGTETPNPMDVVVVADRTLSLSSGDRTSMKTAIKGMLLQMDPSMHFLALGTIHKSETVGTCVTGAPAVSNANDGQPSEANLAKGKWVPTDFSAGYVSGEAGSRAFNTADPVYRAIDCLPSSDGDYGTHLAAPMKAAARKVLGLDAGNLSTLNASNPREGTVKKVIIFETDGEPNEKRSNSVSADISVNGDPRNTDGVKACNNLVTAANGAKNKDVLVITIGFGGATTARCEGSSSKFTRDVLAEAASPAPSGAPSTAEQCNTPASRTKENTDGDYFFCAVDGSEFGEIFKTAISQVSGSIRLIKLP